jgi:hypothetical protein
VRRLQKTTWLRLAVLLVLVIGIGTAALLRAKSKGRPTDNDAADSNAVGPAPAVDSQRPAAPATPPAPISPAPPPPEVDKLNEAVLMARLRSAAGSDSARAVQLARAGNRRFPDSPDAPERASILVHALVEQGSPREARAEAEYAVNHYPDSAWVRGIESFTGAHRHRNLIVTDGGSVRYQ